MTETPIFPPSIVNSVLGPITLGPSSSHLAGPLRLALLARDIAGGENPARAQITFNQGGSLAGTYRGHRTDCALAAGLMGWSVTDPRIPSALEEARRAGMSISFATAHLPLDHPNAISIALSASSGQEVELLGTSEGGGQVQVSHIDGIPTRLDGQHPVLLVWSQEDRFPVPPGGERMSRSGVLSAFRVPGSLDEAEISRLGRAPGVTRVRFIAPVVSPPGPSPGSSPLFSSGVELLRLGRERNWDLPRLALEYEMRRQDWPAAKVREETQAIARTMLDSLERGLSEKLVLSGGISKPLAPAFLESQERGDSLISGVVGRAAAYAMAVNEVSASMGRIAAAPTAGGSGVLPGSLVATIESRRPGDILPLLVEGLLAAGAVGTVFSQKATFLAELAGCQVETGAGSAMAAAALVHLGGGNLQQSLEASSLVLQNILGMECDPVAGLMEVPCITRNALGAMNALLCADLVLAGLPSVIPLDEVLEAVLETGRSRGVQCSGRGGLALTHTSRTLKEEFLRRHQNPR